MIIGATDAHRAKTRHPTRSHFRYRSGQVQGHRQCVGQRPSPRHTTPKRPFTNFIRAEITALGYFLYHVENTPDDGFGCPGPWLFELAWTYFAQNGVPIAGVRGSWTFATNLQPVNDFIKNNRMPQAGGC